MDEQVSAWLRITDRYLTWIEILDEKKEEEITPLGLEPCSPSARHCLMRPRS